MGMILYKGQSYSGGGNFIKIILKDITEFNDEELIEIEKGTYEVSPKEVIEEGKTYEEFSIPLSLVINNAAIIGEDISNFVIPKRQHQLMSSQIKVKEEFLVKDSIDQQLMD